MQTTTIASVSSDDDSSSQAKYIALYVLSRQQNLNAPDRINGATIQDEALTHLTEWC
jgi:hypothetical protein